MYLSSLYVAYDRFSIVHRQSPSGPVDPSFRALSGHVKFMVRRHTFNKDSSHALKHVPERVTNRSTNLTIQHSKYVHFWEGRYEATWKREFKLPWRKTGPLISMIKWTRTSRLSIKISLSLPARVTNRSTNLRIQHSKYAHF